jgi:hypothetical protein
VAIFRRNSSANFPLITRGSSLNLISMVDTTSSARSMSTSICASLLDQAEALVLMPLSGPAALGESAPSALIAISGTSPD